MESEIKPSEPSDKQLTPASPAHVPQKDHRSPLGLSIIVVAVLVIVIGIAFALHHKSSTPKTTTSTTSSPVLPAAQVTITASGFSPATIKIKKGQTVIWLNQDSQPHQPASDPYPAENALPGFVDDTALITGETYGFKFNQTGTFTYHDHLNPLQLKGTVIVE